MKAKTQLLALVSIATLALGGVTVTSSLLLNTPENHSINAEPIAKIEPGVSKAGNAIYVSLKKSDQWYADAGGNMKLAVYFWNDNGASGWTGFLSPLENHSANALLDDSTNPNDEYYFAEGIVPGVEGTVWTGLKICRFDPNTTAPTFDKEFCWNEGKNIETITNTSSNLFDMKFNEWDNYDNYWETYTSEERLAAFAESSGFFGDDNVCDPNGANSLTNGLGSKWEECGEAFKKLGADVQNYFTRLTADQAGSTAAKFAAQYDYILAKYSLDNWANR